MKCYEQDDELDFSATDEYSFYVNRSPIPTHTFLCTYHGAASDIIANEQPKQKVLIPAIREKLAALQQGPSEAFEDFMKENYFDLHYKEQLYAPAINLGLGHL